ncbi:hypothetical protein J4G02_11505 [Candidatus Poribacteria bacterium]|nr:hypothetical protein [Candidatus Poribacteria bacterium]
MALSEQYQQQIINTIKELPEDKLAVVVDFVTSLKDEYQPCAAKNIVKLGGLWEGFEPTDEEIQEARKEIWHHLDTKTTR